MFEKYCAVSPEGDRIIIALPDKSGASREIALSFDEASALAMTLPKLLSAALRLQYADDSLRHVYPLRGYAVECALDRRHLLVSLSADQGYDVVFAIGLAIVPSLVRALSSGRALLEESAPVFPH
jgi:hypothetical protein